MSRKVFPHSSQRCRSACSCTWLRSRPSDLQAEAHGREAGALTRSRGICALLRYLGGPVGGRCSRVLTDTHVSVRPQTRQVCVGGGAPCALAQWSAPTAARDHADRHARQRHLPTSRDITHLPNYFVKEWKETPFRNESIPQIVGDSRIIYKNPVPSFIPMNTIF